MIRLSVVAAVLACGVVAAAQPAIELQPQTGTGWIEDVAFSPDRRFLATVDRHLAIKLWEVRTGRLVRIIENAQGQQVAWSRHGVLAMADTRGAITTWDSRTGDGLVEFAGGPDPTSYVGDLTEDEVRWGGHRDGVDQLIFTDDGAQLLSTADDHTIKLWDVETGHVIHTWLLPGAQWDMEVVPPDPDAAIPAPLGWDASEEDRDRNYEMRSPHVDVSCPDLALRPDRRSFAAACSDGVVRIYGLDDLAEIGRLRTATSLTSITYAADGERVIVGSSSQLTDAISSRSSGETVTVYDAESFEPRMVLHDPGGFERVTVSSDGRSLLGANLWDLTTGTMIRSYDDHYAKSSVLVDDGESAIALSNEDLYRWDLATGETLHRFGVAIDPVGGLDVSRDGRTLIASGDDRLYVWDLSALRVVRTIDAGGAKTARLSPDGTLVAYGWGNDLVIREVRTGAVTRTIAAAAAPITGVCFAEDGQTVYISSGDWSWFNGRQQPVADDAVRGFDVATGALRVTLAEGEHDGGAFLALAISADGRRLAAVDVSSTVTTWDVTGAAAPATFATEIAQASSLAVDADGSMVAVVGRGGMLDAWASEDQRSPTLQLVDVATGEVRSLAEDLWLDVVTFSPDGAEVVVAGMATRRWRIDDGQLIESFRWHRSEATAIRHVGPYLASASSDGTVVIGDLAQTKWLNLQGHGDDWIAYDLDGYFDASAGGGDLVAVVQGMRAFAIDQFAVFRNRPDLLLENFDLGDPELRSHLRKRAELRARAFGLATGDGEAAALDAPEVEILRLDQDGDHAELELRATDAQGLAFVNVLVDGVPVYAGLGADVEGTQSTHQVTLDLAGGAQRIEVTAYNQRGVEALRDLALLRAVAPARGDLHVLAFGVSRYRDAELRLGFPAKDATDLAKLLSRMDGFNRVHVHTFLDEDVTTRTLRDAKALLVDATTDDTVIVFVAGHGLHDDTANAEYYFLTQDADPERLEETAAPFSLIEDLLAGIAPRRKLLLLDTCESGEIPGETYAGLLDDARGRGLTARAVRRRSRAVGVTADPGDRAWLLQRDRFIYDDVSRRTGAIVFSSSRGGELSYEADPIANGFFTEALVLGLTGAADTDADLHVSIDELRTFVSDAVATATGDLQHPVIDRDNRQMRLTFAVTPITGDVSDLPFPGAVRGRRGCACAAAPDPAGWWLGAVAVIALRRRRRRR